MSRRAAALAGVAMALVGCGVQAADEARSGRPTVSIEPTPTASPNPWLSSDGRPKRATLSIASIGVENLVVEPYRGWTDDVPGTEIQDGGIAASPHGLRGGTGPGASAIIW